MSDITNTSARPSLTVPTIEEQTGWHQRTMPQSICGDFNVARRVTEYDFDLADPAFLEYAERRGVLYKARRIGSRWFVFTGNHAATKRDFLNDPHFQRAAPHKDYPQGYVYSDEAMEQHWEIMLATKGFLQDCWQLFCTHDSASTLTRTLS